MDVENFAMNEFARTLSNCNKNDLKDYTFVIIQLKKQLRLNVFYKGEISLSVLSRKRKLESILTDIGFDELAVKVIIENTVCLYLDDFMISDIPFRFKGKLNLNDWSSFTTTVDNKEYHINAQISRSPIDWGIDCGRIAKLEVFDLIKDKRVIAYCKGDWCQYPRTKSERKLYNAFIKKYN